MGPVVECARQFWRLCEEDPEAVLLAEYDPFLSITHPEYLRYREELLTSTKQSVDGSVTFFDVVATRGEIYAPVDAVNQRAKPHALGSLRAWGVGAGRTMDNGNAKHYMKGGCYSEENQTEVMKKAFKGVARNTNCAEGAFGTLKYVKGCSVNVSTALASGVSAARADDLFAALGSTFVSKRRSRLDGKGGGAHYQEKARARRSSARSPRQVQPKDEKYHR
jgi:hypothetical protein